MPGSRIVIGIAAERRTGESPESSANAFARQATDTGAVAQVVRIPRESGVPSHGAGAVRAVEEFLRASAWFAVLPDIAKARVLADSYSATHATREMVARRGDPARSWIGVVEGLLKVDSQNAAGRTTMFCAVPANAWIGEGSVIKDENRRYELVALRPTRVVHIPRATFMWLLETSPAFSRFVIDHLNERLGQFIAATELLRIEYPPARVAAAICNLHRPVLCSGPGPLLKFSQEEIGELAGLSRATANVALKKLAELGLLRLDYGALLIIDRDALLEFGTNRVERGTTTARPGRSLPR